MSRSTFIHEMQRLETELIALGHFVQQAITRSVEALGQRNLATARAIIKDDQYVNTRRYDIEMECLTLIATQQPIASDLRLLAAIIAIASELERIHDYAKGIGKINLLLDTQPLMKPLVDLPLMAQKAEGMLHRAMLAFARRDVVLAREIPREDDDVDALYDQIYREVVTYMLADPSHIEQANFLIWAAHNLERTADRVTNICERVVYAITGDMVELDVSDAIRELM